MCSYLGSKLTLVDVQVGTADTAGLDFNLDECQSLCMIHREFVTYEDVVSTYGRKRLSNITEFSSFTILYISDRHVKPRACWPVKRTQHAPSALMERGSLKVSIEFILYCWVNVGSR